MDTLNSIKDRRIDLGIQFNSIQLKIARNRIRNSIQVNSIQFNSRSQGIELGIQFNSIQFNSIQFSNPRVVMRVAKAMEGHQVICFEPNTDDIKGLVEQIEAIAEAKKECSKRQRSLLRKPLWQPRKNVPRDSAVCCGSL
jgi:hypothetical protein